MTEEQIDQLSLRHGGSRMTSDLASLAVSLIEQDGLETKAGWDALYWGLREAATDLAPHTLREINEADADRGQA